MSCLTTGNSGTYLMNKIFVFMYKMKDETFGEEVFSGYHLVLLLHQLQQGN